MHWSDEVAQQAIARNGGADPIVIASGISLSGPVHIGHSREFLTANLIARAVERNGCKARFIAFADDIDPLRKVYPFLDPSYARWVGCPLNQIPDPYGTHANYAEHYLGDLLQGFKLLGIEPEVMRSSEMYSSGKFSSLVVKTIQERNRVNAIIKEVSGKEDKQQWPIMPECPVCHSIQKTRPISLQGTWLQIHCDECQKDLTVDLEKGGGKLIWRCDWPMRWAYLGVQVEPFGHDHNTTGGSYDSGKIIAAEIYGVKAPIPVPYSWIHLKSGQAMHSSTGNAVPIIELATAFPPEIIWWMLARRDTMTVIPFDPEASFLDEARLMRDALKGKPEYAESLAVVEATVGIRPSLAAYPLDHLVLVAQLGDFDPEASLRILRRSTAYADATVPIPLEDMAYIKNWLNLYGAHHRIRIRQLQEPASNRNTDLVSLIESLKLAFRTLEWEAQVIHNTVHNTSKQSGLSAALLFEELYQLTIGQRRGPKIGWLFETLGREKVLQLLS